MKKAILTGFLSILLCGPAFAATDRNTQSKGDEMERASCGSILDLFAAADPASNGKKSELAAAQDRAYIFVMWAHGYLSGRDGIDFSKRPLNQAGITQVVSDIYKVCAADEQRAFLDAIKEIR